MRRAPASGQQQRVQQGGPGRARPARATAARQQQGCRAAELVGVRLRSKSSRSMSTRKFRASHAMTTWRGVPGPDRQRGHARAEGPSWLHCRPGRPRPREHGCVQSSSHQWRADSGMPWQIVRLVVSGQRSGEPVCREDALCVRDGSRAGRLQ